MLLTALLALCVTGTLPGGEAAPRSVSGNSSSWLTSCDTDEDCQLLDHWEPPYQTCVRDRHGGRRGGVCNCTEPNPCRQRTITDDWQAYAYYCGPCGLMGSECEFDPNCPSNCYDGYCKCGEGNIFYGICRVDEIVSSASTTNLILFCVLILLILVNKLVTSTRGRRAIRRAVLRCWRRGGDGGPGHPHANEDGVYHNPRSCDKSASYTMANSDFITSSDDPDLEWAIELSRQLAEAQGPPDAGDTSSTRNSTRSRTSNRSRHSARSRISNTSRRSVVDTDETRKVAGPLVRTAPSSESRETISELNKSISDTDFTRSSDKDAHDNSEILSMEVRNNTDDKSVVAVKNVEESEQSTSAITEPFHLNTNKQSMETKFSQTVSESVAQPNKSSVMLRNTQSSADERQTQDSGAKKVSGDESDSGEPASSSRGNKVPGRGKMIILVPKTTYSFNPSRSSSQL